MLRGAGRIFLGLGEVAGEEAHGPSEEEHEKPDRPLWLMMIPVILLLIIAIASGFGHIEAVVLRAAARFIAWDGAASVGPAGVAPAIAAPVSHHPSVPWLTLGLAVLIAVHDLSRGRLPKFWRRTSERVLFGPLFTAIDRAHDGVVGDYVVWILIGLALFSVSAAAALHVG